MASSSSSSRLKLKTKDEGVELKNSTLCRNCLHEEKDHLGQSSGTKNVENILAGLVKSAGSDSWRTLGSIAKARAGLTTAGSRSSKVSSSSSSKAQAANEESNEGMRPQSRRAKAKFKKSTQSTKFRVSSIMVLPCGTKLNKGEDGIRERQLPEGEQGIPDRVKIQKAVLRGHAVLQTEAGIEPDRTDDHDELTQAFRQQLPYPFAYFGRLEDKSDDPAWWLATVSLFFPEIFGDSIAQEIDDSYIDLTGETAVSGGPSAAFVRPATPPPKPTTNQTLSPEFKVDPSLGNPYTTCIYDF
ncbi:hypothetical protein K438DRAFT_1952867 [Mycena galopus ATCC 62051]|nr:hypothetical protein K438DRAFT_1952867 [Mycena galopus ATCC 62051]